MGEYNSLRLKFWVVSVFFYVFADSVTTMYAISIPFIKEFNPIIRFLGVQNSITSLIFFKLLAVVFVIVVDLRVINGVHYERRVLGLIAPYFTPFVILSFGFTATVINIHKYVLYGF